MERSWEILEQACACCTKCALAQGRHHVVLGRGRRTAKILFVGEGPGEQEDLQGRAFVGPAGQLLDRMLAAVGLSDETVYIANIVKCRPPHNRDPLPEEQAACMNYLRYQFLLLRPKMVVCLGRIAAQALIDPGFRITREHGVFLEKKGVLFTATFHPSALLRDESKKVLAWEDLKAIRQHIDAWKGEQ